MGTGSDLLQVVGAGPAGLAAAITLARAGRQVVVHEARRQVGDRFGADLQALENWSTKDDVLHALRGAGITTAFETIACRHGIAFDAWDGSFPIRSRQPLCYLVERGPRKGSFDRALLEQALALGVEVRFGSRKKTVDGPGILAVGPKAADAIAVGYLFETDMPDGFWLILDDDIAPKGYGYLLVMRGRGTVKSCMFSGFKQERLYVARTVERFKRLAGLEMRNVRPHGGVGNFRVPSTALSGIHPIAGEQAGFQDAFAGFGMRYAVFSGVMSARALLDAGHYDGVWRRELKPFIESSVINRALYGLLGNRGYRWLLRGQRLSGDARGFLRWLYGRPFARRGLLPWALRRIRSGRVDKSCDHVDCDCVWCRYGGGQQAGGMA